MAQSGPNERPDECPLLARSRHSQSGEVRKVPIGDSGRSVWNERGRQLRGPYRDIIRSDGIAVVSLAELTRSRDLPIFTSAFPYTVILTEKFPGLLPRRI